MEQGVREPLPPGQVWGKRFVIYAAMGVTKVDPASWKLQVTGLVENPVSYSYEEFQKLPMKGYSKSFHCLLPTSTVFANPRPISIQEVSEGTSIIGADGQRHSVTKVIKKHHDGQVIGVKATYLPPEFMTPDHPVWIVRGHPGYGKSKSKRRKLTFAPGWTAGWTEAKDLQRGDYVFFPKYRFVSRAKFVEFEGHRFKIDPRLGRLLGWYVAEGSPASSSGRMIGFALNSSETLHSLEIRHLLEELLGAKVGAYRSEKGTGLTIVVTSSKVRHLVSMMKQWCGNDALSKRIPEFMMNADTEVLREFLGSYFHGDGYSKEATEDRREDMIDFTTSSRTLAYQLLLALSKIGIPGELVNHPGSVRDGYSIRVRGEKIKRLLPKFKTFSRVDRFHYKETEEGFYYPITKTWTKYYAGEVYDFQAPPGYTMLSPFVTQDCVTSWSIEKPAWEGVPLRYLADQARVKPEAKWAMFYCYDGYTAPVPVADALSEDSIVALKLNGKPLSAEQGFPARPFIPHLYGWKSAKWLGRIDFIPEYVDGYWEAYGYHERGNVAEEERFKGHKGKQVLKRAFGTA